MSLYYHTSTFEIDDKPDELVAGWEAANNPKRLDWLPLPEQPAHDDATQHAPKWVDGAWLVVDKTVEELAVERKTAFPAAQKFQVVDWMTRAGIDDPSAMIVAIITGGIADPLERRVQINRWHALVSIPRDHPLVNVVGAMLPSPKTPQQIDDLWPEILAK